MLTETRQRLCPPRADQTSLSPTPSSLRQGDSKCSPSPVKKMRFRASCERCIFSVGFRRMGIKVFTAQKEISPGGKGMTEAAEREPMCHVKTCCRSTASVRTRLHHFTIITLRQSLNLTVGILSTQKQHQ